MYKIEATRSFEEDLTRIDRQVTSFILQKAEWIAAHPEVARFPLKHLPDDLKGLHKYRLGDYRMFFWIDHNAQRIILYRVLHRSEAYRSLE